VTKPLVLKPLELPSSEKQIPQVIENIENGWKSRQALERADVRPRQAVPHTASFLRPHHEIKDRSGEHAETSDLASRTSQPPFFTPPHRISPEAQVIHKNL